MEKNSDIKHNCIVIKEELFNKTKEYSDFVDMNIEEFISKVLEKYIESKRGEMINDLNYQNYKKLRTFHFSKIDECAFDENKFDEEKNLI
jgi:hypothetical protein